MPKISDKLNAEKNMAELSELTAKVTQIKEQLRISDDIAKNIKEQFERTFEAAKNSITLVGGSDDDLAKMWGYHLASLIYDYLAKRDTLEGRQALSFIRMQLGYEINSRLGGSEMHYAGFVLGLSLRFIQGFEKLKQNLVELEAAIKRFEKHEYASNKSNHNEEEDTVDLFGRKRSD